MTPKRGYWAMAVGQMAVAAGLVFLAIIPVQLGALLFASGTGLVAWFTPKQIRTRRTWAGAALGVLGYVFFRLLLPVTSGEAISDHFTALWMMTSFWWAGALWALHPRSVHNQVVFWSVGVASIASLGAIWSINLLPPTDQILVAGSLPQVLLVLNAILLSFGCLLCATRAQPAKRISEQDSPVRGQEGLD